MPKGSEELTNARKAEIVDACASLYEKMGFQEITIRDIGEKTSFTRTSIYNYFQTKEEIFLALLQREYEAWSADLDELSRSGSGAATFADTLAATLEKRICMLKLTSMNLYDMEGNSRMENLISFKRAYGSAADAIQRCLAAYCPHMTEKGRQEFRYLFFPFLFGVYPYTNATEKQKEAMDRAHIRSVCYSVRELVRLFVSRLLQSIEA